jgi:hypothetical protein
MIKYKEGNNKIIVTEEITPKKDGYSIKNSGLNFTITDLGRSFKHLVLFLILVMLTSNL